MSLRIALFALGLWLGLIACRAASAESAPSPEELQAAIGRLAHPRFQQRERAMQYLWRAGDPARSALRAAACSDDREVAFRAQQILDRFQFGIYVHTPAAIVDLIDQYRFGIQTQKIAALRELLQYGEYQRVMDLVDAETNPRHRPQLILNVLKSFEALIPLWLVERRDELVQQVRDWGFARDQSPQRTLDYAAHLYLSGADDEVVARLRRDGTSSDAETRLLAQLLRMRGELGAAYELAQQLDDATKTLTADLLSRRRQWRELTESQYLAGRSPIEQTGYRLVIHRLAGDTQAMQDAAQEVRPGIARSADAWQASQALMINGRWEDAIRVQAHHRTHFGFILLRRQKRFSQAFQLAGIDDPRRDAPEWFRQSVTDRKAGSTAMKNQVLYGLEVARALDELGEDRAARQLLAEIETACRDQSGSCLGWLFSAEYDLGLHQQAWQHAADALAYSSQVGAVLTKLFGSSATASVWWELLQETEPHTSRLQRLQRLRSLLQPATTDAELDVVALAYRADKLSAKRLAADRKNTSRRDRWLRAISQFCEIHGRIDLAAIYLVQVEPSAASLLQLGDFWREHQRWSEAAEWYERSWRANPTYPLPLFLQGYALEQAGKEAEGRRLQRIAEALPRAQIASRHTLGDGLRSRGLVAQANRQWELILRFGSLDLRRYSTPIKDAARYLGDQLAASDPLRAARLMERRMIYHNTLKRLAFREAQDYPTYLHRLHRNYAVGLLQAGRTDEAIEHLGFARAALPGEIELPIQALPQLRAAGRDAVADDLFRQVYEHLDHSSRQFPSSSRLHAQLARLALNCNRRLPEGLRHAQRAHQLAPEEPRFLDTLAELHFRMGDLEEAVACAKRSIHLAPDEVHYQTQLARFVNASRNLRQQLP